MSKTAASPCYARTIAALAVVAAFTWAGAILVLVLMLCGKHLSPLPAALFVSAGTITIADMILWAVETRVPAVDDAGVDDATDTFATMRQFAPALSASIGRAAPIARGVAALEHHRQISPAGDTLIFNPTNAAAFDGGRRIRVVTCVLLAMLLPEYRGFDAVETAYEIGRRTGPRDGCD